MNIIKKLFGCKEQPASIELTKLHVLRTDDYPCDKCNIESKYCHKLHFSNTTICVVPQDQVNTYKRVKRVKKPQSKI